MTEFVQRVFKRGINGHNSETAVIFPSSSFQCHIRIALQTAFDTIRHDPQDSDGMPHNHLIFRGGKKEKCGDTCEAEIVVNSLFRSTALVNAVHVPGGHSAGVRNYKRPARAGACRGVLIDGYINHWGEARFRKLAPTKEPELISAVTDGLAALSIGSAASPGGVPVSLDTKPGNRFLPCNRDCKIPGPNLPAVKKKQWRRKKFRPKRRESVTAVQTGTLEIKEEEEWEMEIEASPKTKWEKTPGPNSYGPEDLMYLTQYLSQCDAAVLPGTASFQPVVHHPRSIRWVQHHRMIEKGQFEDAELASRKHAN